MAHAPERAAAQPPHSRPRQIRQRAQGCRRARSREAAARPGLEPRRAGPRGRRRDPPRRAPAPPRRRARSRSAICRCVKGWCSTTSPGTARRSRRPTGYPDVRRRSVFELAERCNYWPDHSQHVARLAIGALRPDARDPRPHRSRARMARNTRRSCTTSASSSATKGTTSTVLSREERRPARLRARRNRDDRAGRALSPPGDAEAPPRRLRGSAGAARAGPSGRWRRCCVSPRASIAATRKAITGIELHDRGDDDLLQLRTSGDAELELWAATRHAAPFERTDRKPSASKSDGQRDRHASC